MRYLILTGKFGKGHDRVASAINESLSTSQEHQVFIVDFIDIIFPHLNKYIYGTFNFLVRKCNKIYNLFNIYFQKSNKAPLKKVINTRIDKLLSRFSPDIIISTIPVASGYISSYKDSHKNIVLYTIPTDVYINKEWITKNTDKYFVASEETKNFLIKKGVNQGKIFITGIPIHSSFKNDKNSDDQKHILIMGGGLGLIPNITKLLEYLNASKNIKTTIITGQNYKLLSLIETKYKNIESLGYTNEVHKYLNFTDILITKPGGITLFEAIATQTPMLTLKPFLSQEIGNAKYIKDHSIGLVSSNDKDILSKLIYLINDEKIIKTFKENMAHIQSTLAAINQYL